MNFQQNNVALPYFADAQLCSITISCLWCRICRRTPKLSNNRWSQKWGKNQKTKGELRGTQVKSALLTVLLLTRRTFDTTSQQGDRSLSVWPLSKKQILQMEHEQKEWNILLMLYLNPESRKTMISCSLWTTPENGIYTPENSVYTPKPCWNHSLYPRLNHTEPRCSPFALEQQALVSHTRPL